MPDRRGPLTMSQPIVTTFLILAIVLFMSYAGEVLKPLALAVLLSFALAPVSRLVQRWGVARTPAAALTVVFVLVAIGTVGYQVGQQLTAIAAQLPTYEKNLIAKVRRFQPSGTGVLERTSKVVQEVSQSLTKPPTKEGHKTPDDEETREKPVDVRIVSQPSLADRVRDIFGPTIEFLGSATFILILVFFLLTNREDLSERLIRLVGTHRVSLTTKTMEEVDQRISRYLMTFAGVNSAIGVVVGLGLRIIGVEYAALWGVLAALLRFIPYVGPGLAFLLALAFSFTSAPGADLRQPLMVVGLFATLEVLANSYLEPVIYGKTTGVSSFGLLVAALFWTWLWGPIGLLLSTPLTVCLTVVGRYVPALHVFTTLLTEEATLTPDVQFCQRLIAMDQDGAVELVDGLLKRQPRVQVFDQVLIPTLSQIERDVARGDIDEAERTFVWRVIGDVLDDLAETPEYDLKALAARTDATTDPAAQPPVAILGIVASDHSDTLALRMLDILLKPLGYTLTIVSDAGTPLELAEQVAHAQPALVVMSHVPPNGLSNVRYLARRLRAHSPATPIIVGCWSTPANAAEIVDPLKSAGASGVVFQLSEARERILAQFQPQQTAAPAAGTSGPARPAAAIGQA